MKIIKELLQSYLYLILVIGLSLIPLFDLLHPGLPITHDGQDHVARIANFYASLSEGNIVPRWASNLNWGYGHPVIMFLYPLPSYLASFFHFIHFSLIDSVKLVFAVGYVASGIAMYLWARNVFGRQGGYVASLLYLFAPYRFVDLYVRGAIGEHMAFVFPPLILYFLLKLSQRYSYWYFFGGVLSVAGLILAHNAITIMFLPLIICYVVFLLYSAKRTARLSLFVQYTSILVIGFGIASFFLLPAYFEGKYTLRDVVTTTEYSSRFVNPLRFFYSPWSYEGSGSLSVEIGFVHVIGIILSLFWFVKNPKEKSLRILLAIFLVFLLFSLFIMTPFSKFIWDSVTTLQKFQFPWRFLSVVVFSSAVLGAFALQIFPKRFYKRVLILLTILLIMFSLVQIKAQGYLQKEDSFFTDVYHGTTDTGESAPIWSVRFMEHEPNAPVEVIDGLATVTQIKRNTTERMYEIESQGKSKILENTLYFPGWKVFIDNKEITPEFQDQSHRGLMTFFVEDGTSIVHIKFEDTKLRMVSNIITLFSFFILIVVIPILSFARKLR